MCKLNCIFVQSFGKIKKPKLGFIEQLKYKSINDHVCWHEILHLYDNVNN